MNLRKPESRFVRLIMDGANEDDIEEATQNWFAYLRFLDTLVNEMNESDSRTIDTYVRFDNENTSDL